MYVYNMYVYIRETVLHTIKHQLRNDDALKKEWDIIMALIKRDEHLWSSLNSNWVYDAVHVMLKDKVFQHGGDRRSANYRHQLSMKCHRYLS